MILSNQLLLRVLDVSKRHWLPIWVDAAGSHNTVHVFFFLCLPSFDDFWLCNATVKILLNAWIYSWEVSLFSLVWPGMHVFLYSPGGCFFFATFLSRFWESLYNCGAGSTSGILSSRSDVMLSQQALREFSLPLGFVSLERAAGLLSKTNGRFWDLGCRQIYQFLGRAREIQMIG